MATLVSQEAQCYRPPPSAVTVVTILHHFDHHDFGKFAFREGRKINFRFMVNFKPFHFFGRDA